LYTLRKQATSAVFDAIRLFGWRFGAETHGKPAPDMVAVRSDHSLAAGIDESE
jgi:hypothetical protein